MALRLGVSGSGVFASGTDEQRRGHGRSSSSPSLEPDRFDGGPGTSNTGKRTSKACEFCRVRKRKCDGSRPCSHCVRLGKAHECKIRLKARPNRCASCCSLLLAVLMYQSTGPFDGSRQPHQHIPPHPGRRPPERVPKRPGDLCRPLPARRARPPAAAQRKYPPPGRPYLVEREPVDRQAMLHAPPGHLPAWAGRTRHRDVHDAYDRA